MKFLTEEGDVVADWFHGSGNTGYAAETNDRYWIGSEIMEEYIKGSVSRFAAFDPVFS